MHQVEAYTSGGIVAGAVTGSGGPWDGALVGGRLRLEQAVLYPMGGGPPERRPRAEIGEDDLLLVAVDGVDVSVHAVWHPIVLDVGPYRVSGDLPAPPGFDPGRALTRPGGAFLSLRSVRVELIGRPHLGMVERPYLLVNRYAVERVAADLDLGFFFPGARPETPQGAPA